MMRVCVSIVIRLEYTHQELFEFVFSFPKKIHITYPNINILSLRKQNILVGLEFLEEQFSDILECNNYNCVKFCTSNHVCMLKYRHSCGKKKEIILKKSTCM